MNLEPVSVSTQTCARQAQLTGIDQNVEWAFCAAAQTERKIKWRTYQSGFRDIGNDKQCSMARLGRAMKMESEFIFNFVDRTQATIISAAGYRLMVSQVFAGQGTCCNGSSNSASSFGILHCQNHRWPAMKPGAHRCCTGMRICSRSRNNQIRPIRQRPAEYIPQTLPESVDFNIVDVSRRKSIQSEGYSIIGFARRIPPVRGDCGCCGRAKGHVLRRRSRTVSVAIPAICIERDAFVASADDEGCHIG